MSDVFQLAKSGQPIKNGTIVTNADQLGNIQKTGPLKERNVIVAQSGILDQRFDDRTYYTA